MNSAKTKTDIVILGAGFGGLSLGAKLKRAGIDSFVILERDEGVGGTWFRNVYPGCACDVPSRLYWPRTARQPDWSRVYATQPEILGNISALVEEEGLAPHIRLGCLVVGATWVGEDAHWEVLTDDGSIYRAAIFVAAAGQLSAPKAAAIPGIETFAGQVVHSARWPSGLDVAGKRVAVIGTGASAIQIVPAIAGQVEQLTVFQRSAPFVMPRNDAPYRDEDRTVWQDEAQQQKQREAILSGLESLIPAFQPGTAMAAGVTQAAAQFLEASIPDPLLREKLRPREAFGCKRPLLSDEYYPTFLRQNVTLETDPIGRVVSDAVVTVTGEIYPVDILVLATGFSATEFLKGLNITGRDGRTLHGDAWVVAPEAHKGMTVAGFPGFFMLFGPNTNFISVLAIMDHQTDFVVRAAQTLISDRIVFEPKFNAQEAYNQWLQDKLRTSAYGSGCSGYYVHKSGRVTSNWFGGLAEYAALLELVDGDEYRFQAVPR